MHNLHLHQLVPPEKDGHRLDQVLAYLFPHLSRAYLQKQIQNNHVCINQKPAKKRNTLVFSGQQVEVNAPLPFNESHWQSDESISLNIVYEDEALLVVDKPPGMVTHPAPGHFDKTLANALLHHAPCVAQLPRSGIIHRLDKDTSGLLVVPKTLTAHTYLVKEMAQRNITRIYQTIVKGHITASGTIHLPIGRHSILRKKQTVTLKGKPAITHYTILEHFKYHTGLEIKLETGRTHQIRVHMTHLKHPILGDPLYGHRTSHPTFPFTRQALHAKVLGLKHPLTGQHCIWESPLPEDMRVLMDQLREEAAIARRS